MQFHLNRPSRRARYVSPHAHTDCHDPRTRPADASTAWRPSPRVAAEPQPGSGALAGAAAGPAGRAVETPYAAAAALSHAPGIGAGNPQARHALSGHGGHRDRRHQSQTTPPHGANAARSPMAGKIWRTTPPSRADTSAAKPRFSVQIARRIRLGRVEPFSLPPDKTLPGTLHHSGIRPAPPSDHTPLARRSAFCAQKSGPPRNPDAHAGLKRVQAKRMFAVTCADQAGARLPKW